MHLAHRRMVELIARFGSQQNLFPQVSLAKDCFAFPPPLPLSQNLLGDLSGKYLFAGVLVIIVFCDIVLERFGLLLQLLSLLPDTEKCFVTLHEWWLQERYSVRPPKQNGHCVVVERDHSSPIFPKVASTGYF